MESTTASNGFYLGWLHIPIFLDFVIYSEQTVSEAGLYISLSSEFDAVFTPNEFAVYVNGTEINYGSFGGLFDSEYRETGILSFSECAVIAAGLTLNAGENIIRIEVKPNTLWGERCGGPNIDYIRIENFGTENTLSWRPFTYNLDHLR